MQNPPLIRRAYDYFIIRGTWTLLYVVLSLYLLHARYSRIIYCRFVCSCKFYNVDAAPHRIHGEEGREGLVFVIFLRSVCVASDFFSVRTSVNLSVNPSVCP